MFGVTKPHIPKTIRMPAIRGRWGHKEEAGSEASCKHHTIYTRKQSESKNNTSAKMEHVSQSNHHMDNEEGKCDR